MNAWIRFALPVLGVLVVAGCSSSDSPVEPSPDPLITGRTYTLTIVNGEPLPYTFVHIPRTIVWQELVFTSASRWRLTSNRCEQLSCDDANLETLVVTGSYTMTGNQISFQETSPGNIPFEGVAQDGGRQLQVELNHPEQGPTSRIYVEE